MKKRHSIHNTMVMAWIGRFGTACNSSAPIPMQLMVASVYPYPCIGTKLKRDEA